MKDYYQDCKEFEMGGTKYYRLLMRCPVCVERDWPTVLDYWQHADCGGNIYLGDDATFYCSKCHETIPCLLAHYHCPNHEARGREYMISRANEKIYPIFPIPFLHIGITMDMGPASLTRFAQIWDNQEKKYDKLKQDM